MGKVRFALLFGVLVVFATEIRAADQHLRYDLGDGVRITLAEHCYGWEDDNQGCPWNVYFGNDHSKNVHVKLLLRRRQRNGVEKEARPDYFLKAGKVCDFEDEFYAVEILEVRALVIDDGIDDSYGNCHD